MVRWLGSPGFTASQLSSACASEDKTSIVRSVAQPLGVQYGLSLGHACPQPRQFRFDVVVSISQPSSGFRLQSARTPSQSVSPHSPARQKRCPVVSAHSWSHAPQLSGSSSTLVSHTSAASVVQCKKPASQPRVGAPPAPPEAEGRPAWPAAPPELIAGSPPAPPPLTATPPPPPAPFGKLVGSPPTPLGGALVSPPAPSASSPGLYVGSCLAS